MPTKGARIFKKNFPTPIPSLRQKLENFTYVYTALFDEDRVMSSLKGAKGVRTHKGMRFGAKRRR